MRVDVDYSDLTTLAKRLTDQPELRKEIVPHFKQMNVDYLKLAFADAPNSPKTDRKTRGSSGDLARSIIQVFPTPLTSVTGGNGRVKYFDMVYLGTRPHEIKPRYKKALAFVPRGSADGIVRKGVMHPGTRPNPFLFRTWLYNAKGLVQQLEVDMVDVINKETKL